MKWLIVLLLFVAMGVGGFLYKDMLIKYANDFGIPQMLGIDLSAFGGGAQAQNDEIIMPQIPQSIESQAPAVPNVSANCDNGSLEDCAKIANEQLNANKPIDAIKTLLALCEAKNNKACELIANIYNTAIKDTTMNLAYNTRSCDNGGLDGCYNLGVKYFRGEGVRQDFKRSFALFKKVCDGGKVEGCNNLAVMYNNANGVKKNVKLARTMFKKACDSGYKPSCENLTKTK